MSGTSMATPAVAGVLACLVERFNEEPDSRFIAESVLKDAGDPQGQHHNDVGRGHVTLPLVEAYLGDATAVNLAGKRKRKKTGKNFFRDSILKSGDCSDERILHHVLHRSDGAYKVRLTCRDHRKKDERGNMIYDEVLLEQWQHTRITQKQFIHAMRKCGKCGKRGLVPIDSTPIESKKKQHPHCTVKVGCHCAAKGTRKMPKELGEAWSRLNNLPPTVGTGSCENHAGKFMIPIPSLTYREFNNIHYNSKTPVHVLHRVQTIQSQVFPLQTVFETVEL